MSAEKRAEKRARRAVQAAGIAPRIGIHWSRAFRVSPCSVPGLARAWRTAGFAVCTTNSFRPTTPALSSSRSPLSDARAGAAAGRTWRRTSTARGVSRDRRRDGHRESPELTTQSFNAARVSPADARDAGRARSSAGVRRDEAPPVAPRMNSTAQVAHIAQMPNTTNHFSISPVL